jgi:hypothetical protein
MVSCHSAISAVVVRLYRATPDELVRQSAADVAFWQIARSHLCRVSQWVPALAALAALNACSPPTDVINLTLTPQATRDAMLNVQIVPLGWAGPRGIGSVGPVMGYGCASSAGAASSAAVQQLQVKALSMQATAVVDVLLTPLGNSPCFAGYSVLASGTAVGVRNPPGLW